MDTLNPHAALCLLWDRLDALAEGIVDDEMDRDELLDGLNSALEITASALADVTVAVACDLD